LWKKKPARTSGAWRLERLEGSGAKEEVLTASVRNGIAILVLVVSFPPLAAAAPDEVVAVLEFSPAQLSLAEHEGYDLISLDGADHTTEPAEPMLPALNVQLLLPAGTTCSEVVATSKGAVALPGTYRILPAPRPASLASHGAAKTPQPNAQTYKSALPYPAEVARLAGVGSLSGHRIANLRVTPLSYVPATGEVLLHTEIEIKLPLEPHTEVLPRAESDLVRAVVERLVENPEKLDEFAETPLRSSDRTDQFDYLIVCPEALADAFAPLQEWKTRKGVRTEVVTVESIDADPLFAGIDQAERIRNAIKHHYASSGITWVLLGGDTEVLPARAAYDFFYDQGLPCDLYYADLDGTWNEDGDGRWGEIAHDSIDMYADVYVGRAPVSTAAEATVFVDKVLAYEAAAFSIEDDWQLDMLFLAEILWDDPDPYTDGGVALDMIDDAYVPPRFDPIVKLYERDGSLSRTAALAELEAGCGVVVHEGHGNIGSVSIGPDAMTDSTLDGLSNGSRGGIWYSVACWSAAIDHDTFGEHWLRNDAGGGVAYVGNSRYGWGCPGYPGECVSDLFSQQFVSSLLVEDLVHAGLVHADAKHHYVGVAGIDDYTRYAMYELNLLGDPEMPIWTDRPTPLAVVCPDEVEIADGEAVIDVTVTSGGSPVEGARVCLATADGSIYEVHETDGAGQATVVVLTDAACEVGVTATAHDHIPAAGSVTVQEGSGVDGEFALATALRQNFPNPFNPATTLAFSVTERSLVTVGVYDAAGRLVSILVDSEFDPGAYSVRWDGRDDSGRHVASGTYFARMSAGSSTFERKMILLK
jgi:hypothetical protein